MAEKGKVLWTDDELRRWEREGMTRKAGNLSGWDEILIVFDPIIFFALGLKNRKYMSGPCLALAHAIFFWWGILSQLLFTIPLEHVTRIEEAVRQPDAQTFHDPFLKSMLSNHSLKLV